MSKMSPLAKHAAGLAVLVLCLGGAYFIPSDRLAVCLALLSVGAFVAFLSVLRTRDAGRLRLAQVKTVDIIKQSREKQSKKEAEILRAINQLAQENTVLRATAGEVLEALRARELADEARRQSDRQTLGDRQREEAAAEERRAQEALGRLLSVILGSQEQIKDELSRISRDQGDGDADG